MRRKVCVVVTARPSYSRIKTALEAIRDHPDLELQLVVAASALLDRYGNAIEVIEEEGFHVTRKVFMVLEGGSLLTSAKSTGFGLSELATAFDELKPDLVVTIADRFETMATAVAASYMNIPLAHIQGGEITGSIDEKVRHAVTKLSDLHLVASEVAAERVIRMGEDSERVFVTGCPSIDLARAAEAMPREAEEILVGYGGVGEMINLSQGYIIVLQHPVTTEFDLAREHMEETLCAVRDCDFPAIWLWPNVDAGSEAAAKSMRVFRERDVLSHVHFYRNFKPLDFLGLLIKSKGIVGNSSVAIRECSYLGVPAVNIGTRQEGRDMGRNVVTIDYDQKRIAAEIERLIGTGERLRDSLYGDGRAGGKIAEVLAKAELSIEKRLTY